MNFYSNYILRVSLPISVIVLLGLIRFYHGCQSERARKKHLKENEGADMDGDGVINSDDFMQLIQNAKVEEAKHVKKKNAYTKLIYFMLLFLGSDANRIKLESVSHFWTNFGDGFGA